MMLVPLLAESGSVPSEPEMTGPVVGMPVSIRPATTPPVSASGFPPRATHESPTSTPGRRPPRTPTPARVATRADTALQGSPTGL